MDEDLGQCGCPHGEDGERTLELMNQEHIPQISWGMMNLPEISPKRILDIGCGGGIFTKIVLDRFPDAKAWGIDISEMSIDHSRKFNSEFIRNGRLELLVGNVESMPYEDGWFDLIVSNASHFFWPDLPENLKEVSRVLREGGVACLTSGIHFTDSPDDRKHREEYDAINNVTDEVMKGYMEAAGLSTEYHIRPDSTHCAYIGVKR